MNGDAIRSALSGGTTILMPGVWDALSARLAEEAGFEVVFISGYATAGTLLGLPDFGYLTQTEIAEVARRVCASVPNVAVIVDGDTGHGNPLNTIRTVDLFEQAGAAGVFLEDQVWPKKCGHLAGKRVVPREEWLSKLRAAVDHRDRLFIVARTDARAAVSLDEACERAKAAAVPGVAAAVPTVQGVTYGERPDGSRVVVLFVGVDCRIESLLGRIGCDPAAVAHARDTDPPLTSPSLVRSLGPGGFLRTVTGRIPLTGAPSVASLSGVNGGRVAVVPLQAAQRIFGRGDRLDAVYVKPGADVSRAALRKRLEHAVGPWNTVLSSTDPVPGTTLAGTAFVPLFGGVAIFALGLGGVLVGNIATLSLEERRRDLAITQALGATPSTIVTGALTEAATVGAVGGVLGSGAAVLLALPLTGRLAPLVARVAGVHVTVHASPWLPVVGALVGAATAVAFTWRPARRAANADVAGELASRGMRAETAPRASFRRAAALAGAGVAGVALAAFGGRHGGLAADAPITTQLGAVVAAGAFVLMAGALAAPVAGLGERAVRRRASTALALDNLSRDPRRTAAMTVAVAGAVAVAFAISSSIDSIHDSITTGYLRRQADWVWVSSLPVNNSFNLDARIPPDIIGRLVRVPGVAQVAGETFLVVKGHIGVFASEVPVFPYRVVAGSQGPDALRRGRVMVGTTLARQHHLRPGDRLSLPTPTGYRDVTVGGIWQTAETNGNSVYAPMSVLDSMYGRTRLDEVIVYPAPGTPVTALAARLRAAAAPVDHRISVRTKDELGALVARDIGQFVTPFWALQRALVLVAFVATLSTLLLVGVQRRRELAILAAVGSTPAQLTAMTITEALTVGVLGTVLGTVAGIGMAAGFFQAAPVSFGIAPAVRLAFNTPFVYGPLVIVTVLLGAALPGWRARRLDVIDALRYE